METECKRLAEAVLRRLCQGAQIDGIRFGSILQVLITDHTSGKPPVRGQTYLSLESPWIVFDSLPPVWPEREEDLPVLSIEEQLKILCGLREMIISDIFVGDEHPHLIIQLEGGRFVFVYGRHDTFECWQLGVALGDPGETWLVVAGPGGELAVWSPQPLP